jgi:hypothetical protein
MIEKDWKQKPNKSLKLTPKTLSGTAAFIPLSKDLAKISAGQLNSMLYGARKVFSRYSYYKG